MTWDAELWLHLGEAVVAIGVASLMGSALCRWVLGEPVGGAGVGARLAFGCLAGLGVIALQLLLACSLGVPLSRSVALGVLLLPLLPVAWARRRVRGRRAVLAPALICGTVAGVQLAAYGCVYAVFQGDLPFLLSTTASRIGYHLWPVALCGVLIAMDAARPPPAGSETPRGDHADP